MGAPSIDSISGVFDSIRPHLGTVDASCVRSDGLPTGHGHGLLSGHGDAAALLCERRWPRDAAFDALVDCARSGDRNAFRQLTERLSPVLVHYLQRKLALDVHTASDIVQDAFVLAWCNLDHIRDGAHLRPWLYKVARYRGVSWIRRRGPRGQPMLSLDAGPDPTENRRDLRAPSRKLGATRRDAPPDASLVALRRAIDGLKPNHAGVVQLHYLRGLDTRETARLLGVSRGTVKMRLLRARSALRDAIRRQASQLAQQDAKDVLRWLDRQDERKRRRQSQQARDRNERQDR